MDQIRGQARGRAPVPLSILDLATVSSGSSVALALRTTTEVARAADRLGYQRLWVAEHHSLPDIASSSPALLLAHLAAFTRRVRLGAGGVMLPNHAPLVVAEQFGTLQALHPGRIDLGIGRAPGGPGVAAALRRSEMEFGQQLDELRSLMAIPAWPDDYSAHVYAVPGPVHNLLSKADTLSPAPLWILGTGENGAVLAGRLGLPFAFAFHLKPEMLHSAVRTYRDHFRPSVHLDSPYAMITAWVVTANTDHEAFRLLNTAALSVALTQRGIPSLMPSMQEAERFPYEVADEEIIDAWRKDVICGDPATVRRRLDALVADCAADELMLVSHVHGHEPRLRIVELIAEVYQMR